MAPTQIDLAVSKATGEHPALIRSLGFGILPGPPAESHPEALYLAIDCPRCRRPTPYPGRRRDGACRPAHCPRCEAPFAFDLLDVYVAASRRA